MNFIQDLDSVHTTHKALWNMQYGDAEKVRIAEMAVSGRIGYLIEDIRKYADQRGGPERHEWYLIITNLVGMSQSLHSTDRTTQDISTRAAALASIESGYTGIKSKLKAME